METTADKSLPSPAIFYGRDPIEATQYAYNATRTVRAPHHTAGYFRLFGELSEIRTPGEEDGCLTYRAGELVKADGGVLLLTDLQDWDLDLLAKIGRARKAGRVEIAFDYTEPVAGAPVFKQATCFFVVCHALSCREAMLRDGRADEPTTEEKRAYEADMLRRLALLNGEDA